jgi:threonine dehydratase
MDLLPEIQAAEIRIRRHVRRTPAELSLPLSSMGGGEVHLKLECFQDTGSFKLRGAANRLLTLTDEERARGVVAASSGNHGVAVAHAAARLGIDCLVYVPNNASPPKVDAIRLRGADVEYQADDCVDTEQYAREEAQKTDRVYVSPYNDPAVIAGQGTVGLELAEQVADLDAVFVSVGGGGLLGSVAGWLKAIHPEIEVVACSSEASPTMHRSLQAGRVVQVEARPTLADGSAGGLEPGTITLPLCARVVDRSILVSESEIGAAMRLVISRHHALVEGSAAVAVAAWAKERRRWAGKRVAIVLCGGNVSLEVLRRVLGRDPIATWEAPS